MQDVNNDMDDLFCNAAERYPLKTDSKDWDKVLAGLDDADAPAAAIDKEKKRKKQALWLLLLLPLALMFVVYYHSSPADTKEITAVNDNKTNLQQTEKNRAINNGKIKDDKASEAIGQDDVGGVSGKKGKATSNDAKPDVQSSDASSSPGDVIHKLYQKDKAETNAKMKAEQSDAFYSLRNGNKVNKEKEERSGEEKATFDKQINNEATERSDDVKLINNDKNNLPAKQPAEADSRIQNARTDSGENSTARQSHTDTASTNKRDSAVTKNKDNRGKKNKDTIAATQRRKGFYAGLLGGVDISNIKLQRINKAGYSLNVLAGYRFSKRLSVETGISLSKKNYYSDGKYFDKTKTGIPDRVKIYFTKGNCNMFEIPVNVKYDFALHHKSNFFVTAGLSSYIMRKESYWYHANYNMMRVYDTTKSYHNSGNNLFSVVNVSAGYQLYLNKNSALRIEPYLRLPLHGIGIANMPIISTGISIGISRKF